MYLRLFFSTIKEKAPITFVRHEQSTWNAGRLIQGQCRNPEITLSPERRASITPLPSAAHATIISSPLIRCIQTAEACCGINERDIGTRLILDEAMAEINAGVYEGRSLDTVKDDPLWQQWMNTPQDFAGFPEGETLIDFQRRVLQGISNICITHGDSKTPVYVFTHGVVMRVLKCFQNKQELSSLWQNGDVKNLEHITLTDAQIERFQQLHLQSTNKPNN